MRIDFEQVLKDVHGKPFVAPDGAPKDFKSNLKVVSVRALLGEFKEEALSGQEKKRRFILAQRINRGGRLNLSKEEVNLVRDVIGKAWSTETAGAALVLLEEEK